MEPSSEDKKIYWMPLWRYEGLLISKIVLSALLLCIMVVVAGVLLRVFILSLMASATALLIAVIYLYLYMKKMRYLARISNSGREDIYRKIAVCMKNKKFRYKTACKTASSSYRIFLPEKDLTVIVKKFGKNSSLIYIGPLTNKNSETLASLLELIDISHS